MSLSIPVLPEQEEIAQDARRGAASFRYFVRAAWSVLEPGTPLIWSDKTWHLDAVCLHLQAVYNREILRLLVNIQPGVAKSTLFSVMWPAWCWLHDASIRWLCASHSRLTRWTTRSGTIRIAVISSNLRGIKHGGDICSR